MSRFNELCRYVTSQDHIRYDDIFDDLPYQHCNYEDEAPPFNDKNYILSLDINDKFCCETHHNFCKDVYEKYPCIWRDLFSIGFMAENVVKLLEIECPVKSEKLRQIFFRLIYVNKGDVEDLKDELLKINF